MAYINWFMSSQVKQMAAKDLRIKLINEILSGIKVSFVLTSIHNGCYIQCSCTCNRLPYNDC